MPGPYPDNNPGRGESLLNTLIKLLSNEWIDALVNNLIDYYYFFKFIITVLSFN